MSAPRYRPAVPESRRGKPDRDAQGRAICRACSAPIPTSGRLRCYCSDECRVTFMVSGSGSEARRYVYRRDHGVCAKCRSDCEWLAKMIRAATRNGYFTLEWSHNGSTSAEYRAALRSFGRLGAWQADHIVPVVEGGGACGLENLRTLCNGCHAAETAMLAGRRALKRRAPLFTQPLDNAEREMP